MADYLLSIRGAAGKPYACVTDSRESVRLTWPSIDDFEAQMARWRDQVVEYRRAENAAALEAVCADLPAAMAGSEPTAECTCGFLPRPEPPPDRSWVTTETVTESFRQRSP